MTITKITTTDVIMDEYQILCLVNNDNLADLVDILKQQIDQWDTVPVVVTVRQLVCVTNK